MKVTILGSGTSSGVPRIGNDWGACDPAEPKNRRSRVSLLVEHGGTAVVVDTGPDFREQMLRVDLQRLDAVFYTHDHADHTHGIDDLRQFYQLFGAPVDCYATAATWAILEPRFTYIFRGTANYPATAMAHTLPSMLVIGDLRISHFVQHHGDVDSTGFRFEAGGSAVAYSTDIKALPPASEASLDTLDLWIVDALRERPHPTHSHLAQTLGWIERFRPKRAVLTHMDTSMDYAALCAALPATVEPGYDGLMIDFT